MSDEQTGRSSTKQAPGASTDESQVDEQGDGEQGDGEQPKISLDRYLSRRRPPVRSPTMQIISLLLMLAALVMVFTFKNRCGLAVADFFGGPQPASEQGQQAPPVTPAP